MPPRQERGRRCRSVRQQQVVRRRAARPRCRRRSMFAVSRGVISSRTPVFGMGYPASAQLTETTTGRGCHRSGERRRAAKLTIWIHLTGGRTPSVSPEMNSAAPLQRDDAQTYSMPLTSATGHFRVMSVRNTKRNTTAVQAPDRDTCHHVAQKNPDSDTENGGGSDRQRDIGRCRPRTVGVCCTDR